MPVQPVLSEDISTAFILDTTALSHQRESTQGCLRSPRLSSCYHVLPWQSSVQTFTLLCHRLPPALLALPLLTVWSFWDMRRWKARSHILYSCSCYMGCVVIPRALKYQHKTRWTEGSSEGLVGCGQWCATEVTVLGTCWGSNMTINIKTHKKPLLKFHMGLLDLKANSGFALTGFLHLQGSIPGQNFPVLASTGHVDTRSPL